MGSRNRVRAPRYRIEVKPAAERALLALDQRDRLRVARTIEALADAPRPHGVKKLAGADDLWRVRVGEYRIIYTIQDDVLLIVIVRIGHRREIYRGRPSG